MHVHESGQQSSVAQVDDLGTLRSLASDAHNALSFDDDHRVSDHLSATHVKHAGSANYDALGSRRRLRLLGYGEGCASENQEERAHDGHAAPLCWYRSLWKDANYKRLLGFGDENNVVVLFSAEHAQVLAVR